jgi:hypothetical protein
MAYQGSKEYPLLTNGLPVAAPTALSSTSRLEASIDLSTSATSIAHSSSNANFNTIFTSSLGRLHVQAQDGSFRLPSQPSMKLAPIFLGSTLSTFEDTTNLQGSCATSGCLSGIDLRAAGHLEHCVQLSNLDPATGGKSLAAFSSMYLGAQLNLDAFIDITKRNGTEFAAGGLLRLAGVAYKSEKLKEPNQIAPVDLEYTTVWQASNALLPSSTNVMPLEGLEVSAGRLSKQQFVNSAAAGSSALLDFPQTLALIQSSCRLYPQRSSINIKSASSGASSSGVPVPGRNNLAAGTVSAALRCVVNERAEIKATALFTAKYSSNWNVKHDAAANDAFGVEILGGVELISRLLPTAPAALVKTAAIVPIAKTWAIGGGNGALGQLSADWLSQQGTSHQILLCRSGRFNSDSAPDGLFDPVSQGVISIQQ